MKTGVDVMRLLFVILLGAIILGACSNAESIEDQDQLEQTEEVQQAENEKRNYKAGSKTIISDNALSTDNFSKDGAALPAREYLVSITLPLSNIQKDKDFLNDTGKNYEHLTGDLVTESDLGKTVKVEDTFTIE